MTGKNGLRSAKRRRKDDDDSVSTVEAVSEQQDVAPQFEHDKEFWLEDGTIILVAGNFAFRVYQGLLTKQSEVFRDMFASCVPGKGESYAGCPLVHMPDSPEDLRRLLRVILPANRIRFWRDEPQYIDLSFEQISATIRMGNKYGIADIERQGIRALRTYFTDRFEEYASEKYYSEVDFEEVHSIGAINCARLTDTVEVLPFAMYTCCALRGDVLDGYTREDGTVEYLSHEDLRRVLNGRDELAREAFTMLFRIFKPSPSSGCTGPGTCFSKLVRIQNYVGTIRDAGNAGVLENWRTIIDEQGDAEGICNVCTKLLMTRDRRERRKMWGRLPRIFDLDIQDWDYAEIADDV
ncbi:hypothetical protein C8Q79DRAFT_1014771 [Trametes meyenii]|nr:hypothetical protein C8Q79DRAFT_1014771 [Trametes meyenii]